MKEGRFFYTWENKKAPLDFSFETIGDENVYSIYLSDPQLLKAVGPHFHFLKKADQPSMMWSTSFGSSQEQEIKTEIAKQFSKYLEAHAT